MKSKEGEECFPFSSLDLAAYFTNQYDKQDKATAMKKLPDLDPQPQDMVAANKD